MAIFLNIWFWHIQLSWWMILVLLDRVSNRKSESMQNQSTSVFLSRSTLGKIETIPQIGEALEKVRDNAILIISASTKNSYVTKPMRVVAEALTER